MLWQRVLTAIPLALLVGWLIFFQSSDVLFYAFLLVSVIAGWEWARLAGIENNLFRIVYGMVIGAVVFIVNQFMAHGDFFVWLMTGAIVWWFYITYKMTVISPQPVSQNISYKKLFIGLITLVPPIIALVNIHSVEQGPFWLFYVMSIVWIADIGAYFSGRRFGKNKLAPDISPGKTREGLYGGVLLTSLYTLLAAAYFNLDFIQMLLLLIAAFFASLLSVVGDLFISLYKRERGIKDSSHILPGHGGVLDRIDSVTSSAPFFVLMLNLVIL
ncbi:MAG: phosphatidate cytidylyltransferase [Gammaproteobacteria bacterium]|nr:phosphatidate cytidylyltransferase [Gammaproteobacteria bacterium]